MNDKRRPVRNAAATNDEDERSTRFGEWIRCPDCGARCPDADHLVIHRVRRCVGAGWRAMRLMPPRRRRS